MNYLNPVFDFAANINASLLGEAKKNASLLGEDNIVTPEIENISSPTDAKLLYAVDEHGHGIVWDVSRIGASGSEIKSIADIVKVDEPWGIPMSSHGVISKDPNPTEGMHASVQDALNRWKKENPK